MLAVIVINLQVAVAAIRVGPALVVQVLHLPYLQLHASEAKKVIAAAISYDQSCSG